MAIAALVVYVGGVLLAFGLRTLLSWRRTGDHGFRRPHTTAFSPAWWGTVLFAAALALGLASPALAAAGVGTGELPIPTPVKWVGFIVMVLGLALVLASQAAMGASWRIGVDDSERTALVTSGGFSVVRNPVFSAMGIMLAGLAVILPTPVSALAFTAYTAAVQVQVRAIEEPYLLATHGATYQAYAARTGRFVPGLGKLRAPHSSSQA